MNELSAYLFKIDTVVTVVMAMNIAEAIDKVNDHGGEWEMVYHRSLELIK